MMDRVVKSSLRLHAGRTLFAAALIACGSDTDEASAQSTRGGVTAGPRPTLAEAFNDPGPSLGHVHGMSYSSDGQLLLLGTHTGLAMVNADGRWQRDPDVYHDLMGFAGVDYGFVSSGHPSPASDWPNPLGLVRGDMDGVGLQSLAFLGESDFHLTAVSYYDHTIYVANPQRNSLLSPGLWRTSDDADTWERSELARIAGSLIAMAVHPTDPEVLVIATTEGLFQSNNSGETFRTIDRIPFDAAAPHRAVAFAPADADLFAAGSHIHRLRWDTRVVLELPAPNLEAGDQIVAIAASPTNGQELAVATQGGGLFVTANGGRSWVVRATGGVLLPQ